MWNCSCMQSAVYYVVPHWTFILVSLQNELVWTGTHYFLCISTIVLCNAWKLLHHSHKEMKIGIVSLCKCEINVMCVLTNSNGLKVHKLGFRSLKLLMTVTLKWLLNFRYSCSAKQVLNFSAFYRSKSWISGCSPSTLWEENFKHPVSYPSSRTCQCSKKTFSNYCWRCRWGSFDHPSVKQVRIVWPLDFGAKCNDWVNWDKF